MTARRRNCTHLKLCMQPGSSGYSAQSGSVGSRLVTENMRTSLSTTCSKTWREGTRYETQKSLQVGNFLGCADIVKALRPLSGFRGHPDKRLEFGQAHQAPLIVLGRLGHALRNTRAAVVLQLGEAPMSNNAANPLSTCRSKQRRISQQRKLNAGIDGRATDLIQRLKGREVLVRRFCYRGKLMLSALTEKLVRGRK